MRKPAVLLGLLMVLVTSSALPGPLSLTQRAAAATNVTIFSDSFEGAFPGTNWNVTDADPASGLDYWGINSALLPVHSGVNSVWCAEVGNSSSTGNPNSRDGVYDTNMTALMRHQLPDLGGLTNVTLTFWTWYSIGPGDRFSARTSGDGSTWGDLWGANQGTSNGWQQENLTIPPGTVYIEFYFYSDTSGVSIGAFVDDVAVVAMDSTPPTIIHSPVTSAIAGQPIAINAAITDNVRVATATVYYESVGETAFAALPMSANGTTYSASIPAQASAGTLQYYIEARDGAGNVVSSPVGGAANAYSVAVQAAPIVPSNLPWDLIGLGAILVLVVLAAGVMAMRRRRLRSPSGERVPPPSTGTSAQPSIAPVSQPQPVVPAPAQTPAAAPSPGLCPACGLQNEASAIYCNRCATRLR